MTVVTVRPDATVSNVGATIGGGAPSMQAATSDNSDTTYAELAYQDQLQLGFAEPTLPAGAVMKSLALRARCATVNATSFVTFAADDGGSEWLPAQLLQVTWTSPTTITIGTATRSVAPSNLSITLYGYFVSSAVDVHELYIDATYVAKPTVVVNAPTNGSTITTTNLPKISWTPTLDADGGGQTSVKVRVFSQAQYSASGFDPATSTPTASWDGASESSWADTTTLTDGTYRAYVQVGQTVNGAAHLSDYAYTQFTIDVEVPLAPGMVVTAEPDHARIRLDLTTTDRTNLVTNPSFETSITGWAASNSSGASVAAALSRVTTWGASGSASLVLTGTNGPDSTSRTFRATTQTGTSGMPVIAGASYYASAEANVIDPAASGVRVTLLWYKADGSASATASTSGALALAGSTGTAQITLSTQAPDDAAFAAVRVEAVTDAPSDAINVRFDSIMLVESATAVDYFDGSMAGYQWDGTANASTSSTVATDALEVQRSTDGGVTWQPLRLTTATDGVIIATDASITDFEAANGHVVQYRARAMHNYSGVYASSGWATGSGAWTSTSWWLKSPEQPALNTPVEIRSIGPEQRTARQGVLQPLGATRPIIVSDTRSSRAGTFVLKLATTALQDAVDALLDSNTTLLLQSPASDRWGSRYVRPGDHTRTRPVDMQDIQVTFDSIAWTEVAAPPGVITGWPPPLLPSDDLLPSDTLYPT